MSAEQPFILVADDEEDVQVLLQQAFAKQGWTVKTVGDGYACLDEVKVRRPDAIVLDVMMPRLDGYHVCHTLRSDPNYASIPIVMLTAKSEPYQQEKGKLLGADCYLCKPCDLSDIVGAVRDALQAGKDRMRPSG